MPISLGVDTGAMVNLLSFSAFQVLNAQSPLSLQSSDVTLTSVQGIPLKVNGLINLQICLSDDSNSFSDTFYVTEDFALECDGILGLNSLISNSLDLYPRRRELSVNGFFLQAMDSPTPLLSRVVHPMDVVPDTFVHAVHAVSQSSEQATPVCAPAAVSTSGTVESKSSVSTPCQVSAVLIGDQYVGPTSAARLSVRLKDAPVGSSVLSLPDTARVKRLAFESTLCTVRDDHITDVLVTNTTGSPVQLKDGVHLGSFEICDGLFSQDPPHLIASVQSVPAHLESTDRAATIREIAPYVKVLDFPEVKPSLLPLLAKYRSVFALPGESLGATDKVSHSIVLQPDTRPSYTQAYRLPHSQKAVVEDMIQGMLKDNIIQESNSPWNSPMFLVKKKDGSFRPVIDFRKVNEVTVPDVYPLPVLSELLQSIGKGNSVFTSLDLKSGFWQIPLATQSREITAFSTPSGHYEWLRCPMGLRNAPLTCQRLVNTLFAGIIGNGLFVYLDDLILVSKNLDSHLAKLEVVLQKLSQAGLTLNIQKCSFLKSRIQFLGHTVDKNGIHTMDCKIKAVTNFPTPQTTENVRSFLGLAGYYRAFVKNFASIASPLTRLLKKDVPFMWHDAQQHSFDVLKHALTNTPVLTFPDYGMPFTMCTDASALGIGAVLMQQLEGQHQQVIAYASRVLSPAESKYSVTHLEALAVVWALKHFREIIFGYPITIYTDHTAVTQLFQGKGKNLSGRLARWYLTIQEFSPTIKYLPGRANVAADALSRNIPVSAVAQVHNFSAEELSKAQRQDSLWKAVVYALESGDESALPALPVPFSQFLLENGLLCRVVTLGEDTVKQLVIPSTEVETALKLVHDMPQAGHPGRDRTLTAARRKYYWPTMRIDIERYVAQCTSCAQFKGSTKTAPILEYPLPDAPFHTVGIDLLQLPRSHQGSAYVLVCVDHFSRFVVLVPLPNKAAQTVAHALVSHLICPYTTPHILLSDNGTEFSNQILKQICDKFNIKQTFIAAHHPASNGLVERTNKKILDVLRHFAGDFHDSWEDWLPHVAASINTSHCSSTGKSPFFVLYGTDKRLPYDVLFDSPKPLYSDDYNQVLLHMFQSIHQSVRKRLAASRAEMIQKQHLIATPVTLTVGDQVMKRSPDRQCKLAPKFIGPFVITEQLHGHKFKILHVLSKASEVVHADRLKKV